MTEFNHHERRNASRQLVEKGGVIEVSRGQVTLPCVVRDISETGARLQVPSVNHVPDTFELLIEICGLKIEAIVVWRSEKEVGIQFQSEPKQIAIEPACSKPPQADYRTASFAEQSRIESIPILIAEDDPDDRILIQEAFRESDFDHHIEFVTNGEELLEYLDSDGQFEHCSKPGLVLLDLNMPKMDGREALRRLKANPATRRIPVVVFTTSNADDDINGTYDLGVSSYITKPSSFEGLKEVIRTLNAYWNNAVAFPT